MGDGPEQIVIAEQLAAVKRLARRVLVTAVITAVVATTPFVLVP